MSTPPAGIEANPRCGDARANRRTPITLLPARRNCSGILSNDVR